MSLPLSKFVTASRSRTLQHAKSARLAWSFFSAFLLLSVLYRSLVCYALYTGSKTVTGLLLAFGKTIPIPVIWRFLFQDLIVGAVSSAAIFIAAIGMGFRKPTKIPSANSLAGLICLDVLLLLCGLLMLAHYHLLFELNTGLTISLLNQATQELGLRDFVAMIGVTDWACMIGPVVAFHLVHRYFLFVRRHLFFALGAAVSLVFLLQIPKLPNEEIHWAVSEDPVRIACSLVRASFSKPQNPYLLRMDTPSAAQMNSIAFVDDLFSTRREPPPSFPPRELSKKYNVLFIVLESTGADYIFDDSLCNRVPMPFLQDLSKRGLFFQNHYTASSSSTRANFCLYTGIFPNPEQTDFSYSPRNFLPTFNRFLGADYKSFLVTPIRTTFCYPKSMMMHNGWEILDYDHVPSPSRKAEALVQNEVDAVTFLLDKIDKTPDPFCGLYVSYLPHWPYTDYGEQFRICPGEGNKSFQQKYYNNLYTMDVQIKRIIEHLTETKRLQNTVVVIAGDHGEGFGQHPGFVGHTHGTFGEAYRTPALFFQPDLFKPQTVEWRTSHVDVVPTLLDALGVGFDPSKFQGESLLRGEPKRKYVFGVTSHECIMALDKSGVKVSISMLSPEAWAYDTAKDPKELVRQPVEKYPEQLEALIKFRNYQPGMMLRYNSTFRPK
ncbi:MAG: sulfatase-like hydrolase/transferase [Verrucomicrobiota bacterium]